MDRGHFRDWLLHPYFEYVVDDAVWRWELGVTVIRVGQTPYTVGSESMAILAAVV